MATAQFPRDAVSASSQNNLAVTTLRRQLDALAARRNARQNWQALTRALSVGVGLAAALMLAHRLFVIDVPLWAPIALVLVSFVVGIRNGWLGRAGAFDAAVDADRVLGLNERLSSAIAFAQPELVRRRQNQMQPTDFLGRVRAALFPRVHIRRPMPELPHRLFLHFWKMLPRAPEPLTRNAFIRFRSTFQRSCWQLRWPLYWCFR
jgi:hypothetical protein